jgi:type IV pilus assembly protein PilM
LLWLELLKAISISLPKTDFSKFPDGKPSNVPPGTIPDHKQYPIDLRKEIHVEYIESEYFPDLATWWNNEEVKRRYAEERRIAAGEAPVVDPAAPVNAQAPAPGQAPPAVVPPVAAPETTPPPPGTVPGATPSPGAAAMADAGPTGPGWIIEIRGHHFYNRNRGKAGVVHVRDTLIKNLEEGSVDLPVQFGTGPGSGTKFETFTMKELGIGYVILAESEEIDRYFKVRNNDYVAEGSDVTGGLGLPREKKDAPVSTEPPEWIVPKYSFTIQFAWTEKLLRARLQEREKKRLEAKLAEEQALLQGNAPAGAAPAVPPATN